MWRIKNSGTGRPYLNDPTQGPNHPIDCDTFDEALTIALADMKRYWHITNVHIKRLPAKGIYGAKFILSVWDEFSETFEPVTEIYDNTKYHAKYGGKLFPLTK